MNWHAIDWNAVAGISQAGGTLAVVVSVLYLAYQIRQSVSVARSEAFRNFRHEVAGWQMSMAQDADLSALITKVYHTKCTRSELPVDDAVRMGTACLSLLNLYEASYHSANEGVLTNSEVHKLITSSRLWTVPFVEDSWPGWSNELGDGFVAYFEEAFPRLREKRQAQ